MAFAVFISFFRQNWYSGYVESCFHKRFSFLPPKGSEHFVQSARTKKIFWIFWKHTFLEKKPCGHKKLTFFDNRAHFVLSKGKKLTLKLPQGKEKQIFRKLVFPRMLQWTKQVHFWQICQSFFRKLSFAVSTKKTKNSCNFQFF